MVYNRLDNLLKAVKALKTLRRAHKLREENESEKMKMLEFELFAQQANVAGQLADAVVR